MSAPIARVRSQLFHTRSVVTITPEMAQALQKSNAQKAAVAKLEDEMELEALREKIENTEAQRDNANEQLEKMVDELQIEATL
jgi:hypothetical protein